MSCLLCLRGSNRHGSLIGYLDGLLAGQVRALTNEANENLMPVGMVRLDGDIDVGVLLHHHVRG